MITEQIQPTGVLNVTLKKSDGTIKEEHQFTNIVVSSGKDFIASRMIGTSSPVMSKMAVGDSNTSLDVGNTSLASELARTDLKSSAVESNVVTYAADFLNGVGTGGIVEAGIFDNTTPGVMLCRTTFPVINKEADDILTINWNVTIN